MNDIKITKQGLRLRDMIPNTVATTIEDIMRVEDQSVDIAVGTAYTRGVMEPEKYPECLRVTEWLRTFTNMNGPEKTWLVIHDRIKG